MKRAAIWLFIAGAANLVYAATLATKPEELLTGVIPRAVFSVFVLVCAYWSYKETRLGYQLVSFLCLFVAGLLVVSPFLIAMDDGDFRGPEILLLFATYGIGVVLVWFTWRRWWRPLCEKTLARQTPPAR
jgi:hypothetical protein